MRTTYAQTLYMDPAATPDDLREAVTMLEETERIARRVLGGAHPLTLDIDATLRNAREIHAIREELEANQAALDEALIERSRLENPRAALRASITRLEATQCALACALVALLVALVFAVG